MKKNVLLTTMSTFPPDKENPNYYYDANTSKYCEGILQTEAGAKLILSSDETIDKIVVIGSDETYFDANKGLFPDDISEINLLSYYRQHIDEDLTQLSPYAFFRNRIGEFCNGKLRVNRKVEIDPNRANEIIADVAKIMSQKDLTDSAEWFNAIAIDELENRNGNNSSIYEEIKNLGLNKNELIYLKAYCYGLVTEDKLLSPKTDLSNLTIQFIPERIKGEDNKKYDNIVNILAAIKGDDEEINLYVDMQGGNRTDGYVRNALLSILSAEKQKDFNLVKVVATNFNNRYWSSAIVDETDRYMITDLVSAMNAFTQYGKADMIKRYCDRMYPEEKHISELVNEMINIDMALSICNIDAFTQALIKCHIIFDEHTEDPIFSLMEAQIRKEYEGILKNKRSVDYVTMCDWAIRKGFVQQALTIIESKLPQEIVEHGICYYEDNKAEQYFISKAKDKKTMKYMLNDLAHLYIADVSKGNSIKKAGRRSRINPQLLGSLLDSYDKVRDKRNKINHSISNTSVSIGNDYARCVKLVEDFLMHYKNAIIEASEHPDKNKIRIYKKTDFNLDEIFSLSRNNSSGNDNKKRKTEKKERPRAEKNFKSKLPSKGEDVFRAVLLGNLKGKQATRVKKETKLNYDGINILSSRSKDFELIRPFYRREEGHKEGSLFLEDIKKEVEEYKTKHSNLILFIDESFCIFAGDKYIEDLTSETCGYAIICKNAATGWHIIEKL